MVTIPSYPEQAPYSGAMTSYYDSVLAEARRIDPNASISNASGMTTVTVNGRPIELTNTMQNDQAQFGITPAQMLQQKLNGGLLNMTPGQNQAVHNSQLDAMNQGFAQDAGGQPSNQRQYDAMTQGGVLHPVVGNTPYGMALNGRTVSQTGPQQFVPTQQPAPPASQPIARSTDPVRQTAPVAQPQQPIFRGNGSGVGGTPTSAAPYGAATGSYGVASTQPTQAAAPSQSPYARRYAGAPTQRAAPAQTSGGSGYFGQTPTSLSRGNTSSGVGRETTLNYAPQRAPRSSFSGS